MVAATRLGRKENVFKPEVVGEAPPALLKVAAIYGPNASGKSNLVKAIKAIGTIVNLEPAAQSEKLPVASFRFDPQLKNSPSRFELQFIVDQQRYSFTLAATQDRIVEERLIAFPGGDEALLYSRHYSGAREEYEFGPTLEGGKEVHQTWRKLTGPQRLFLSQAVANSSEDLRQLRTPFAWLSKGVSAWVDLPLSLIVESASSEQTAGSIPQEMASFMRDLDLPVTDIRFDRTEPDPFERLPESVTIFGNPEKGVFFKSETVLEHRSALGEASFDMTEESLGTQNLMGFYFLWMSLVRQQSTGHRVLVIDEFDNSLHPQIVAALVRKFLQQNIDAQLIFTTHDTHLMDAGLLRRDQFWLTERDANGATRLVSIHDFQGREGEDVEKRYYEGRYRGLPILREG